MTDTLSNIHIRPATESDYDQVHVLAIEDDAEYAQESPDFYLNPPGVHWKRGRYISWLEDEENGLLVAESEGKVVGYVQFYRDTEEGSLLQKAYTHVWVKNIHVFQAMRGQGVGRKLMEGVEAWAAEQGISILELDAMWLRKDAVHLYKELGYEEISVRMRKTV